LLSSNLSRRLHNMVNFGPLAAEICWRAWGTPAHFNGFRVLASLGLLHRRPTKLCTMLSRLLGWYTVYTFWRPLPPNGILPAAKFTLRLSLAFSCIISVTARHSSSGRQLKFVAWYKKWNYGTFAECATYIRLGGHHVGHRPTF